MTVSTLPAAGTLTLSGAAITAGQFVSAADVSALLARYGLRLALVADGDRTALDSWYDEQHLPQSAAMRITWTPMPLLVDAPGEARRHVDAVLTRVSGTADKALGPSDLDGCRLHPGGQLRRGEPFSEECRLPEAGRGRDQRPRGRLPGADRADRRGRR